MAEDRDPILREATFADCAAVIALKRSVGLPSDSPENWQRLWRDNPALALAQPRPAMGWVLELDGRIVGYMGSIPLLCRYGEHTLVTATANGFAVHPAYRSFSLSLAASYFRQEHVDLLLNTTANDAGSKIFQFFKARRVPQADYDELLFWVLRPRGFAASALLKRDLASTLAWAGSLLGGPLLWADSILRQRKPARASQGLTFETIAVSAIGTEFDVLWERTTPHPNPLSGREGVVTPLAQGGGGVRVSRLLSHRTAEILRWHFGAAAARRQTRVVCCRREGQLLGYAVLERRDAPEIGLKRTRIADLFTADDDPAVIGGLLWATHRQARASGSHVLEMIGFPQAVRARFRAGNPYSRKVESWPYLYRATDHDLARELENDAAWYACPYDGDASL